MSVTQSIIITGGNTGLGFETAKVLLRDRSTLIVIACRNPSLGQKAVEELKESGGQAVFLPIDLGDQASIRHFVDLLGEARLPPLLAIICNAGMMSALTPQRTVEGYETTFAVNHLGHYLLVRLLLDGMQPDGRITFISSGTHDPKQNTGMPEPVYKDADALAHDFAAGRQAGLRRYTTSKLCNIMCTYELSRRLALSGDRRLSSIKVNAFNPGMMPGTGLARSFPKPMQWIGRYVLPILLKGKVLTAQVSGERVAALTLGSAAAPGGRYFAKDDAIRSSDLSYDEGVWDELWVSSAKMTGLPIELSSSERF